MGRCNNGIYGLDKVNCPKCHMYVYINIHNDNSFTKVDDVMKTHVDRCMSCENGYARNDKGVIVRKP
jgi:hypothetical protein